MINNGDGQHPALDTITRITPILFAVLLHDRPPICAPVGGDLRAVVYGAAAAGVVIPSVFVTSVASIAPTRSRDPMPTSA